MSSVEDVPEVSISSSEVDTVAAVATVATEEDNKTKIKLKSNDGKEITIGLAAAKMSAMIRSMLQTVSIDPIRKDEPIPLTNDALNFESLQKIVEWCEYHWDDPEPDPDFDDEKDRRNEELSHWDKTFIAVEDMGLLYDIIVGANFLDIKGLVEVGGKQICGLIKGKTCQEVRTILKITNDFTEDEEAAIHKENEWIYAKD